MTRTITVNAGGKSVRFNVTMDAYNRLLNELTPTKKTGPMQNFLMRTVEPDDKPVLKDLLAIPGALLSLAGLVMDEYAPDIEATLGE